MKLRLNNRVLADMPTPVRLRVQEWRMRWRKNFISVCTRTEFCPGEDSKVVIINLLTGAQQAARVAGEWAGLTRLSPTDNIPLPEGCVAVVTGIFLGHPWLTLYQGAPGAVAKLQAEPLKLEYEITDPVTVQRCFRDYVIKASAERPARVRTILLPLTLKK